MDELYIGLMSGTSIDGIDACLVRLTDNKFQLLATHYQPYPNSIKDELGKVIKDKQLTLHDLATLDHKLAILNSQAVTSLLEGTKYQAHKIQAIGYHGQTVFHEPDGNHPNSIQLGDPNVLVAETGITTVADLRRMDMAAGGQGAPLAPGFHQFLFRDSKQDRAILNIGGIANLTLLPADPAKPVTGFDSGPGNCLMDEWNMLHHKQPYDENGQWASQGQAHQQFLNKWLQDPYFAKAPPKSTGREYFHLNWLKQQTDISTLAPGDLQASLAQLTASSISQAVSDFAPSTEQVFVCGGGAHNAFLLDRLKDGLGGIQVETTDSLGLSPDWVEACAFAWFAQQRIHKQPANIPSVTGANKAVLLGAIYHA
jgi:anhydro-N-acetylmuramic acid kinase